MTSRENALLKDRGLKTRLETASDGMRNLKQKKLIDLPFLKENKEIYNHWLFLTGLGQILKDEISSQVKSNRFSISHSTSGFPRTDIHQNNRRHLHKCVARTWVSRTTRLLSFSCRWTLQLWPSTIWDFKRSWVTFEENYSSEVKIVMIVPVYFAEYDDLKFYERSSKSNVALYYALSQNFSLAKFFQDWIFVFRMTVVNTHSGFIRDIVVSMEIGNH